MDYVCDTCGKPTDHVKQVCDHFIIHRCEECEKLIDRQIDWELTNEHHREYTVCCPYCDYEYEDYDSQCYDEGEYTVKCPVCGKIFDLEVVEIRLFSTKRNKCEMPEDWEGEE